MALGRIGGPVIIFAKGFTCCWNVNAFTEGGGRVVLRPSANGVCWRGYHLPAAVSGRRAGCAGWAGGRVADSYVALFDLLCLEPRIFCLSSHDLCMSTNILHATVKVPQVLIWGLQINCSEWTDLQIWNLQITRVWLISFSYSSLNQLLILLVPSLQN